MARLDKTLGDYVAIAISPVLIMLMVGSLLHFLVAVCYRGAYGGRIDWILSCFTVAIVLIARISIEEGQERALLFGAALAGAVGLAVMKFSNTLVTPWILLGVTWWAAHQITWDCTLIDEDQDSSGQGLLQIVRFKRKKKGGGAPAKTAKRGEESGPVEPEGVTARVEEAGARWLERIRLWGSPHPSPLPEGEGTSKSRTEEGKKRESPKAKPHAPGVWIVYFSLAALPLFGLGQLLIPSADVDRRRWAFALLCVYVASGLALLVTTSFLGLRRYLRQRGIEMPTDVAGVWIGLGAVIIVVLLFVAALLPRPAAEYAISKFPVQLTFTTPPRDTSPHAVGNDGPTQEEEADRKRADDEGEQASSQSDDSDRDATSDPSGKPSKGNEKGQPGREQSPSDQARTDEESRPSSEKRPDRESERSSDERRDAQAAQGRDAQRRPSSGKRQDDAKARRTGRSGSRATSRSQSPPKSRSPSLRLPRISISFGGFLKLIFYVVFFGLVGYWLWKSRGRVLAAIQQLIKELREFWAKLFGGKKRSVEVVEEDPAKEARRWPFSDYVDPFASGLVRQYTAERLIRYTFEALEAWGRENDCAREPDQTPREFARQVAAREASLGGGAKTLAGLYSHVAYASGRPSAKALQPLEEFWRQMRATAGAARERGVSGAG